MGKNQADSMKGWQHRLQAVTNNGEELVHLLTRRDKLQGIYEGTIVAIQEQSAARAVKQEASRRVEELLAEGNKVDTFLCVGLREFYGNGSEKLAEFGIQPFRGRRPAKVVTVPPPTEDVK